MLLPNDNRSARLRAFYLLAWFIVPASRIANRINWRFLRPYKCYGVHLPDLAGRLKPGMVILTHKDFEFTNLFIRGYWTHTAIITGENQVIQADRRGVVTESLYDYLRRADDFIILSPVFCGEAAMAHAVSHVRKYLGYPYNFTFDWRAGSVYCSELVYRAYTEHPEVRKHYLNGGPRLHRLLAGFPLRPQHIRESDDFRVVAAGCLEHKNLLSDK